MAFVVFPDKVKLEATGYAAVSHVPFMLSSDERYLSEASRYLRERALLEWPPLDQSVGPEHFGYTVPYPTITTLRNIADRLKNFLEWCENAQVDWRLVEYTQHLILGYQRSM